MKPMTFNRIFAALFATLIAAGLAGCGENGQSEPQQGVKTVNVETRTLQAGEFDRSLRLVGTVQSRNDVRLSAEVSGRVERYYADRGDRVNRGERILKIDDSQLLREKERLEAITAQARENYQRLQRLFEQDSVGSEIEYLNAKYNYQQNKASLEALQVRLSKTTVTAPFDATVENIFLEEGEMASPGTPLLRLIGPNRLKTVAGVPARYSDVVHTGDQAEVWFDYQSSDTLRLPIAFVAQSIDPQARTFRIEVNLPAGGSAWKVDMVANMKVRTLHQEGVLVVGEEYVYEQGEGYVVYTVGQNDAGEAVARQRPVRLGASHENSVIIAEGLSEGDRLITVGSSFLQDGMRITVVDSRDGEIAQQN